MPFFSITLPVKLFARKTTTNIFKFEISYFTPKWMASVQAAVALEMDMSLRGCTTQLASYGAVTRVQSQQNMIAWPLDQLFLQSDLYNLCKRRRQTSSSTVAVN